MRFEENLVLEQAYILNLTHHPSTELEYA